MNITPEEIAGIRDALVKNCEQMGHMFGVSGQTWSNWEAGVRPLPIFRRRLIKLRDFLLGANKLR